MPSSTVSSPPNPSTRRRRKRAAARLLTLIPPGSFLALVVWGNRLHPLLAGMPFFPASLVLWTAGSALCLFLAERLLGPDP